MKSEKDLLKPGLLTLWDVWTGGQRRHVRNWVRNVIQGDWDAVMAYLHERRRHRKIGGYIYGRKNKEYCLMANEVLNKQTDVMVMLPLEEGTARDILLLRTMGLPIEEVSEHLGISEEHIKTIATKEALAKFKFSDIESAARESLKRRTLANLLLLVRDGGLSIDENTKVLDLMIKLEKHGMDVEKFRKEMALDVPDADKVDKLMDKILEKRHDSFRKKTRMKEAKVVGENH